MLEYHAAYFPIEDGWYMGQLLDFPGVVTQGRDLEEARYMVRDALKIMPEVYMDEGEPLPRPNPRARNKKAEFIEPVCLWPQVLRGKPREMKKIPKVRAAV